MHRRSPLLPALLVLLAALLGRPGSAAASGRFPAASAMIFDPHDARTVYVRTTFGLVATHDGGDSWRWICERAIGYPSGEDPELIVTKTGALVAATSAGLAVSRDGGCGFELAGGSGARAVSGLAVRGDGSVVTVADGRALVSKDDAKTFSPSGSAIAPGLQSVTSIAVAPSDPLRLYASESRGGAVFFVSYDEGLSWVARKVDLAADETAALVAAVDPKNADRVYVRTRTEPDGRSRLLATDDAGKSWRKVFDAAGPLLGFALSEDGAKAHVGSREGEQSSAVSSAAGGAFAFVRGSSIDVQCLGLTGRTLWACSTERSGFFVGSSKNEGRGFDARLRLEEIKGPLACPPESSVAKACTDMEWVRLRHDLGLPDPGAKPRSIDPGGPALRGRETQTRRTSSRFGAVAGIAFLGLAAYFVLDKLRKRKP